MSVRIVSMPGFDVSVAALGDTAEVRAVVRALIGHVSRSPYDVPKVPGREVRVIKSRSYGPYPAIRLLYRVVQDTVYLYEAGFYDELEG